MFEKNEGHCFVLVKCEGLCDSWEIVTADGETELHDDFDLISHVFCECWWSKSQWHTICQWIKPLLYMVFGRLFQNPLVKCTSWSASCGTSFSTNWMWYGATHVLVMHGVQEDRSYVYARCFVLVTMPSKNMRFCPSTCSLCEECECPTFHHIPWNACISWSVWLTSRISDALS